MNKALTCFCMALLATASLNAEEMAIRKADDLRLESFSFKAADNSQIVFWSDLSSGDRDIWCQKINPSAQVLFSEAVPIVNSPGDQELLAVTPTSDNNFIILWAEREIDDIHQLRIQKVTSNGQRLWGEQGALVTNTMSVYTSMRLAKNEIGGAFVVYQRWINLPVMAQNFDAFGNSLWAFEGLPLVSDPNYLSLYDAVPDGSGGMIVNVGYYLNSLWQSRLLRFSAAGTQVGPNPLIPPSTFPDGPFRIIASQGSEFLLYREPANGSKILYLNKMDSSGNLLFTQATAFELGGAEYGQFKKLAVTADGGVAIAWVASEFEGASEHFVQKLSATLTPVWPQPVSLFEGIWNTRDLQLSPSADGKLWIAWLGYYEDPCLRAQVLDANGNPIWEAGGKLVTSNADELMSFGSQNTGIYLWNTRESGFKTIKLQALGVNGAFSYPPGGLALEERLNYKCDIVGSYNLGDRFLSLWIDHRDMSNLYFQVLNQNNQQLLEPNGRAIRPEGIDVIYFNAAITTPEGKLAILYSTQDYSTEPTTYATYLQMIDADGNLEYPGNGLSLSVNTFEAVSMSSYDNALLIGWVVAEYGQPSQLRGQRIANGQPQWGENGRLIFSPPANTFMQLKGMAGSYFLWETTPIGSDFNYCKALRVDEAGDPAPGWDPSGVNLISGHGYLTEMFDRTGLIGDDLVAFISLSRPGLYGKRVQRLSSSGARLWGTGGTVIGGTDAWMNINSVIFADAITFLSSNPDEATVLRRIDSQGLETTPPHGIVVVPATNNCYDAALVRFANGAMLCAYSDNDGEWIQNRDVFIRHISPDGVPVGDGPILLCSERYKQDYARVAVVGNKALVTWADDRAGIISSEEAWTGIWGNTVTSVFTAADDPQLSPVALPVITGNYPNPFNPSTSICFSLPASGPVSLGVYNLKGQLVKILLSDAELASGPHSVIWDGTDVRGQMVSSGLYFCRLSTARHTSTRKMLLAK